MIDISADHTHLFSEWVCNRTNIFIAIAECMAVYKVSLYTIIRPVFRQVMTDNIRSHDR